VTAASTDLVGSSLDGFRLEERIGEGAFAVVYRAVSDDGLRQRAFKVAKPASAQGYGTAARALQTRALMFVTGGLADVHPEPSQVLAMEANRLRLASDPCLINIEELSTGPECPYLRMELRTEPTLRQLMGKGPVPVTVLAEIARCLGRLSDLETFHYHGDVKPDNIIVTDSGIKLIDPGYDGPIDTSEFTVERCIITTPAYYPSLVMDDLSAFGIMLWELAVGEHPLSGSAEPSGARLGSRLTDMIAAHEVVGHYFYSPLRSLRMPSVARAGIPVDVEHLLRRALAIEVTDDGKIELGDGFASFDEMVEALETLKEKRIKNL